MSAPRRQKVEPGIYKRPDGKLEIGYRDADGRQRWQVVDGGVIAARKQLTAARHARDRGDRATVSRLRFNDAADAWLVARVARLRPTTRSVYGAHLKHLRERYGNRRLTTITATEIASYIAELERDGAAGWTARGRMTVLSGIFAYATRHLGHGGPNPVAMLDRVERPSVHDERQHRILTDDETAALLAGAADHHRLLLRVAVQSGCRKGEALGLTWADVDARGGR